MPQLKDEPSEIELTMNSIGVDVVFTPKAHCEIAGRGIEHVWGASKLKFRRENDSLTRG